MTPERKKKPPRLPEEKAAWAAIKALIDANKSPVAEMAALSDYYEEHGTTPADRRMAYALKWCAARGKWPYPRARVVLRYLWVRHDNGNGISLRHCPSKFVITAMHYIHGSLIFFSGKSAFRVLANALDKLIATTGLPEKVQQQKEGKYV